jgi:hypothetical protein
MAFRLHVGGVTLAVAGGRLPGPVPAVLRRFAAARGEDVALRVELRAPPVPEGRLLFESGGPWRVHRHGRGLLYLVAGPHERDRPYRGLAVSPAYRRGVLYEPPGAVRRGGFALGYPLGQLLLQHRLSRDGAAEVHASGVVASGRALVFAGASGAGKTTLARVWRRRRFDVLSDDRVVLRRRRGGVVAAWGTPWHGTAALASPRQAPLGAVFFLRHGPASRARRLVAAEAAARLVALSFPPPWDPAGVAGVLSLAEAVARSVPCFELEFTPDAAAVVAALAAARQGRAATPGRGGEPGRS